MHRPWYRTVLAAFRGAALSAAVTAVVTAVLVLSPAASTRVEAGEGTADDAYRAALAQESAGNATAARLAYERVLALDPEHRAARRALGYEAVDGTWLRGDALRRARGFVRRAGSWVTSDELAQATEPEQERRARRAGEAEARLCLALVASGDEGHVRAGKRRLATIPPRYRLGPLARALRGAPRSLRLWAAGALGRLEDPRAGRALLACTVRDPVEEVRHAAADGLRALGTPGTVHPLGRALWSRDATIRVRAAEALGRIGDVAAAPYLVARWEKRSGAFPRAVFTQIDQFAYLQDFDVEVASTSFIADPIVGVLQQGVVQDVRIHATEHTFSTVERVAYATALQRVSGLDHGHDVAAWRRWLDTSDRHDGQVGQDR